MESGLRFGEVGFDHAFVETFVDIVVRTTTWCHRKTFSFSWSSQSAGALYNNYLYYFGGSLL